MCFGISNSESTWHYDKSKNEIKVSFNKIHFDDKFQLNLYHWVIKLHNPTDNRPHAWRPKVTEDQLGHLIVIIRIMEFLGSIKLDI